LFCPVLRVLHFMVHVYGGVIFFLFLLFFFLSGLRYYFLLAGFFIVYFILNFSRFYMNTRVSPGYFNLLYSGFFYIHGVYVT